jgi:hypothetical protein
VYIKLKFFKVQWCGEEIEAEAVSVKEKSCVKN